MECDTFSLLCSEGHPTCKKSWVFVCWRWRLTRALHVLQLWLSPSYPSSLLQLNPVWWHSSTSLPGLSRKMAVKRVLSCCLVSEWMSRYLMALLHTVRAPGCKNRPAPFPGRMFLGLFLFYILACFIVLLFIRTPFYVLLVVFGVCSVFWLFWLSFSTCQVIG